MRPQPLDLLLQHKTYPRVLHRHSNGLLTPLLALGSHQTPRRQDSLRPCGRDLVAEPGRRLCARASLMRGSREPAPARPCAQGPRCLPLSPPLFFTALISGHPSTPSAAAWAPWLSADARRSSSLSWLAVSILSVSIYLLCLLHYCTICLFLLLLALLGFHF